LKNWADNCPDNFAHKYYLLSAKKAIIENESLDTVVGLFTKAKNSIGNNDFIQFRAFINELYGKFWLEKGDETIGKAYIREAHYLYKQWGAHRKVFLMEKQYSNYFRLEENNHRGTMITKGTRNSTTSLSNIDMSSILKCSQAISSEIKIDKLLTTLISTMIENAGAERGCLLLKNEADGKFYIEAIQYPNFSQLNVIRSLPFTESSDLCLEIVQYVTRTGESVVIHNACADDNWQDNPYIKKNQVKSVLCIPVIYQNRLKGIVYLENNLTDNVFTSERIETLKILSSQASISIENARLYESIEQKVKERTAQLNDANEKLKELSFHDPLTSLHNRRYAFEYVNNKISQFIKSKTIALNISEKRKHSVQGNVVGVILLDIDHFKEVNDNYGHSAGDIVLITISNILKKMVRTEDIVVRWGGEEFLIILYNTKLEYIENFSKKVLKQIKETPIKVSEDKIIHKTCSLGCVEMPLVPSTPDLLNMEQMVNLSDYALYYAKEHGRNCAAHFKLIKEPENTENIKKSLINLSRSNEFNNEYFNMDLYRNEE
jgi:histidine kinase